VACVTVVNRDAQIHGAWWPERLNFVQWGLTFSAYTTGFSLQTTMCISAQQTTMCIGAQQTTMCISAHAPSRQHQMSGGSTGNSRTVGHKYGTRLVSPFWRQEFRNGTKTVKKIMIPLLANIRANKSMGH